MSDPQRFIEVHEVDGVTYINEAHIVAVFRYERTIHKAVIVVAGVSPDDTAIYVEETPEQILAFSHVLRGLPNTKKEE